MGTTISLLLPEGKAELGVQIVRTLFSTWEQTLSRFLPDSELSQLNAHAGTPVAVSDLLYTVLATALTAAQATQGVYDPALLDQLVRVGYDRTFDDLAAVRFDPIIPGEPGGRWRRCRPGAVAPEWDRSRPGQRGRRSGCPGTPSCCRAVADCRARTGAALDDPAAFRGRRHLRHCASPLVAGQHVAASLARSAHRAARRERSLVGHGRGRPVRAGRGGGESRLHSRFQAGGRVSAQAPHRGPAGA